ncbi:MAG TPA: FmdB family zinc ribbon protein [Tepidisphaeraceae bacterium]|nr:FmdB family zinc ribbon protein [Tepidisphaeraceae bacterium]
MPTYEYKCNNCGHRFEKFHSILAAPIKKCPECGKNAVERLISAGAGLIFKGSGFYITDYRDSAYKDQAKAESGNGSSDAKKDADAAPASGESKPAAAEGKSPAPDSKAAPAAESKPAPKSENKSSAKEAKASSKADPKPKSKSRD